MSSAFDEDLERHLVAWRAAHVSTSELGNHAGRPRSWILPQESWEEGLWPDIRRGGCNSITAYMQRHGVEKHVEANNLKSSWTLCANLYFALGGSVEGKAMLAGFLRAHVAHEIESVDSVEIEFAEEGALHPSRLLGEAGGRRGKGQTSPDVAFVVNGRRGIILTEVKLTEHSFYECSAHRAETTDRRAGNPDPLRCKDALHVLDAPAAECHQETWGRKYFDHLGPVANRAGWARLAACPAAVAGYQLFRQQALAEALAKSGKYEFVVSCVAIDARNETLKGCLAGTGIDSLGDWGDLFQGRARFVVTTHQDWVAWVRDHAVDGGWREWLAYVEGRYGYSR